jgi:hypothetical protein
MQYVGYIRAQQNSSSNKHEYLESSTLELTVLQVKPSNMFFLLLHSANNICEHLRDLADRASTSCQRFSNLSICVESSIADGNNLYEGVFLSLWVA